MKFRVEVKIVFTESVFVEASTEKEAVAKVREQPLPDPKTLTDAEYIAYVQMFD